MLKGNLRSIYSANQAKANQSDTSKKNTPENKPVEVELSLSDLCLEGLEEKKLAKISSVPKDFGWGVIAEPNDDYVPFQDPSEFKTISLKELKKKEFKANWLVQDFIEQGNWGLIFGKSASYKSIFVQEMGFCIAAGLPFHGKETQQGNVLYVAGEGQAGLSKRFNALEKHYGESPDDFLHFSCQPADFINPTSAKSVAEAVNRIGDVKLMIIDTLHRNMGSGNENSAEDIAKFLHNIDIHLKGSGMAVIVIHHSGVNDSERARGSSSLLAGMDVAFRVEKDNNNLVTVSNSKMKEFDPPKPMSFQPKTIDLGDEITGIVLTPTDFIPKPKTDRLTGNANKTLQALQKIINRQEQSGGQKGQMSPNPSEGQNTDLSPCVPLEIQELYQENPEEMPSQVVSIKEWRDLAYQDMAVNSGSTDAKKIVEAKKKSFKRYKEDFENKGLIKIYGDYVWLQSSRGTKGTEGINGDICPFCPPTI